MEEYKSIDSNQLSIADGMIDWVRVVDRDNMVLYANKKMQEDLGENIVGKRCYDALCRDKRCEYCISGITLEDGSIMRKQQSFGNKTYTIISSPLYGNDGEIKGSVEVFRDITNEVLLSDKINEKNRKMSEDIKFAKNMQNRMLPPKGMYNGVSIDYLYESSESLSGDYFDVFEIDENNTGIYICDVVGHGVTASLLTIFVRQSLRTIAKGNTNLNKIMKELHKTFLSLNLDYDKYFSVFFGIYNKDSYEFKYVNAGHNSVPILISDNNIKTLMLKGYPIANIFDKVDYIVGKVTLKVGDKILLYTDGITEATNSEGIQFGVDNLINTIKLNGNILKNIEASLNNFSTVHKDDYAVLLAEII
ncbi:MAG: SpoIIE family protein phosphatase [Tissierellia bacterium]|nr:SpoIIE family protein phosphatase [Tissierellia bacterium]MDD3751810.1 SpoIIE family protein phosphatase [Tissierellia bacterium]MDD4046235.1 SpoIIE family protein phosphatase [Tissierellia bacterium]MDD4678366.1 SpoIIE family protein phosphatase [Tissierellia bacterium]